MKGCEKVIDKIKADLIAKTHYESVYKFCLVNLNHNTHDAQDITQEVFLLFQEKSDSLEDFNIKGWLFKTAHLKIKEYNRKLNREINNTVLEDFNIADESANVCAMLEELNTFDSEDLEKYRNIIFDKLNEKEQILYQKRYIENKSHKQIAEELKTNHKNVSVMISRLNKKLNFLEAFVLCTVGQFIIKLFLK